MRLNDMRQRRTTAIILVPVILMAAFLAAGCTGAGSSAAPTAAPGTTPPGTDTANAIMLTVNGSVSQPLELTLSDLNTYPTVPVNMSAMGPGMDMNRTGNADMAGFDRNNGTWPGGAGGNWQPGAGGNLPSGADVNSMAGPGGGQGGNWPSGSSGGFVFNAENLTGISLNRLLDKAKPSDGATNVTFIGMGGRAETLSLAEIRAQPDAAIVVMGTGMLQAVVPGTSSGILMGLTGIVVS